MKKYISILFYIIITGLYCLGMLINSKHNKENLREVSIEAYKVGWVHGYNAMVEVCNNKIPINDSTAYELLKKDSTEFRNHLNHGN
jgi:hypothetical protein